MTPKFNLMFFGVFGNFWISTSTSNEVCINRVTVVTIMTDPKEDSVGLERLIRGHAVNLLDTQMPEI